MKRVVAALLTAAVIGLVVWSSREDLSSASRAAAGNPDECIERMFAAAAEGRVEAYLDCFAGEERARLDRELASQSREAFASSLISAVAALKGRAVFASPGIEPDARRVERTVDRIYAGKTERQRLTLERRDSGWRIVQALASDAFQPAIPYGAPVFETAEGANRD